MRRRELADERLAEIEGLTPPDMFRSSTIEFGTHHHSDDEVRLPDTSRLGKRRLGVRFAERGSEPCQLPAAQVFAELEVGVAWAAAEPGEEVAEPQAEPAKQVRGVGHAIDAAGQDVERM